MTDETYPPAGMAIARNDEVYTWADCGWNPREAPTPQLVADHGYRVVPKDLLDKATAARDAWIEAGDAIDDWLESQEMVILS